jgi:hypothetical protein
MACTSFLIRRCRDFAEKAELQLLNRNHEADLDEDPGVKAYDNTIV